LLGAILIDTGLAIYRVEVWAQASFSLAPIDPGMAETARYSHRR
jgi:hypothetical protein